MHFDEFVLVHGYSNNRTLMIVHLRLNYLVMQILMCTRLFHMHGSTRIQQLFRIPRGQWETLTGGTLTGVQ